MEIQVFKQSTATPAIWNHEELKAAISAKMEGYKNLVFTEETQADAKKYRAALNKLMDALKGFAREEKQKALAEYDRTTKKEIDELVAIIQPCRDQIDAQEKALADAKKQEKLERIKSELYAPMIDGLADIVPYEKLHDPKWLNVTCSINTIGTEMARKIENIVAGLDAIDKMGLSPNMASRIKCVFLKKFDLAAAIAEKERIEQMEASLRQYEGAKAAKNAEPAEIPSAPKYTPPEPAAPVSAQQNGAEAGEKIHTVVFRIRVTAAQLNGLGAYMKANGIRPERV